MLDYPTVISHSGAAVTALAVKYIWDRYLSKASRITADQCNERRELMLKDIVHNKESIEKRLDTGDKLFEKMEVCLSLNMHIIFDLCKEVGLNCEELREKIYKKGML